MTTRCLIGVVVAGSAPPVRPRDANAPLEPTHTSVAPTSTIAPNNRLLQVITLPLARDRYRVRSEDARPGDAMRLSAGCGFQLGERDLPRQRHGHQRVCPAGARRVHGECRP